VAYSFLFEGEKTSCKNCLISSLKKKNGTMNGMKNQTMTKDYAVFRRKKPNGEYEYMAVRLDKAQEWLKKERERERETT
jgi:hypothetical protein